MIEAEVVAEWGWLAQQRQELVSGGALHSVANSAFVEGVETVECCGDSRVSKRRTFAGKKVGARWHLLGQGVLLPIETWEERAKVAADMAYKRSVSRFSFHYGCSAFEVAAVRDAQQIGRALACNPGAYSEKFTRAAQQHLNELTGLRNEPIYIGKSEIVPAGFQNAIGTVVDDTGQFNSYPLGDNHPVRRCFVLNFRSANRLGPDADGFLYWQRELWTTAGIAMEKGFGRERFRTSPFVILVTASKERQKTVTTEVENFVRKHLSHLPVTVQSLEKPPRHHHHHDVVRGCQTSHDS